MQWRASNGPARDADRPSVTERLWALRLEDQKRRHGLSANRLRIRQAHGDGSLGALYAMSADMHWSQVQKRQPQRLLDRASPLVAIDRPRHEISWKPTTFREECLLCILSNLSSNIELQDAVAFLPFSFKHDLLNSASSCASLDDMSLDSLLFSHDYGIAEDVVDEESATHWENSAEPMALPAERLLTELDLSNSKVSVSMLTSILRHVENASDQPRLLRLRRLNLARTPLTLNHNIVKLFSNYSLASLCLSGLSSTLFEPFKVLSKVLPYLRDLDVSQSGWLSWDDLQHLDWSTRWRELESINLAGCDQLLPSASYMDPEARSLGPPVIMQITSLIREKGRVKWLDVIA